MRVNKISFLHAKKALTLSLVLFPILSMYATPILGVTIADAFFLAALFLCLFFSNKISIRINSILVISIFILFHFLLLSLVENNLFFSGSSFRTIKYVIYLFFLTIHKQFFLYDYAFDWLRKIAVFSSVFIIIQQLIYSTTGVYMPGAIPGIPLTSEAVELFNSTASSITEFTVRPRSIFSEPATYSQYIIIYLSLQFGNSKFQRKDLLCILGIIISRASTGIFGLAVILFYLIFKKNKIKKQTVILLMITVPVILFLFVNSDLFDYLVGRIFNFSENSSFAGRFSAYQEVFSYKGIISFLFGNGMIDIEGEYISAFPRIYFYFGIFGYIIMTLFFTEIWVTISKSKRLLMFLFFIFNFFGDTLFGANLLIFIPFLINNRVGELNEKSKYNNSSL